MGGGKEKKELLKNAVSLVRVKIEIEPLTGGADSSVTAQCSKCFAIT
jgi:hypothetical protein